MKDRIKSLRKELGMTQEEFAEKLNISRSNLGNIEIGRISITDRVVDDICNTFNINREWLKTGNGEKTVEPDTFSLDSYAKVQKLKEVEINLIRCYMELDSNTRSEIFNMFKKAFSSETPQTRSSYYDECPNTPEELEKKFPPLHANNEQNAI